MFPRRTYDLLEQTTPANSRYKTDEGRLRTTKRRRNTWQRTDSSLYLPTLVHPTCMSGLIQHTFTRTRRSLELRDQLQDGLTAGQRRLVLESQLRYAFTLTIGIEFYEQNLVRSWIRAWLII